MTAGLSPERLLERARHLARLDDFGPDIRPALNMLCDCFDEAPLTALGQSNLALHVTQALVTRLRLVQERKRTPALFEGCLNDPIVIVGLPRTGTSYLQQLLACLPGRRYLHFWEAREPIPDIDDQRVPYYEHVARLLTQAMPELAAQHPIDAHGAEECMFLLDPSLISQSFVLVDAPCRAYFDWAIDPRHHEPYLIYRQLLLYLQASTPGARLVLKSPAHFAMLTPLTQAVPEARLVHTHRDPLQILPSMCSLQETFFRASASGFDRRQHGASRLAFLEGMMARNAEQRALLPAVQIFDLDFGDLIRQPLLSVRLVHEHFGFGWSDADEQALLAELARGVPAQVGRHHYRLEDYGLHAAEVAERLQAYRQRFGFAP